MTALRSTGLKDVFFRIGFNGIGHLPVKRDFCSNLFRSWDDSGFWQAFLPGCFQKSPGVAFPGITGARLSNVTGRNGKKMGAKTYVPHLFAPIFLPLQTMGYQPH